MSILEAEQAQSAPEVKTYDFEKVEDSRGNPIEGLWIRNGRYYGQVYVSGKGTRRFSLSNERHELVSNVSEARAALQELRNGKRQGNQPQSTKAPLFSGGEDGGYLARYITHITNRKSELTVTKEKGALNGWAEHLGSLRINQIKLEHINDYTDERLEDGKSNRTVNLDVIALGNLLKFARDENWLRGELITERWATLEEDPKKRELFTYEMLDRLVAEALRKVDGKPVYVNGELFADWVKLMAYSGARRLSALSVAWADVDFDNKQLHLRKNTKYGKHIVVDFNPKLEAHLLDMMSRRIPGSDYLFPGRWKTVGEAHLGNMQKTIVEIRDAAKLPKFTPHDLRHAFISYAVMDGVDFMTIAKWVGHADGGILIGKVYGHLSNTHLKRSAEKLTMGEQKTQAPSELELMKQQLQAMTAMLQTLTQAQQKTS